MGVSLERVQNKFACIIGELCGEPKVMSQFAVWLDLRLAEYKSKGAISLECSGDMPDPSWLEGLKLKEVIQQQAPLYSLSTQQWDSSREITQIKSSATYTRMNFHSGGRNGSDPDLVIKSEKNDQPCQLGNICPTGIGSAAGMGTNFRKRPSSDSMSGSPRSASKFPCTSAPSSSSVFSHDTSPSHSFVSPGRGGDSESSTGEIADADMALIIANDMQGHMDNVVKEFGDTSHSGAQSTDISVPAGVVGDMGERQPFGAREGPLQYPNRGSAPLMYNPSRAPPAGLGQSLQSPGISYTDKRNDQTFRNIVSAAGTFERWLWVKCPEDRRRMEQISPAELDRYLADFFMSVKKRSGQDYNSDTLLSLRSNIERYLREKGYPCSITKSEVFNKSQVAFKMRRQELMQQYGMNYNKSFALGTVGGSSHFLTSRSLNPHFPMAMAIASADGPVTMATNANSQPTPFQVQSAVCDSMSVTSPLGKQQQKADMTDKHSPDLGDREMKVSESLSNSPSASSSQKRDPSTVTPSDSSTCNLSEPSCETPVSVTLTAASQSERSQPSPKINVPSSPLNFFSDMPVLEPSSVGQTDPLNLNTSSVPDHGHDDSISGHKNSVFPDPGDLSEK